MSARRRHVERVLYEAALEARWRGMRIVSGAFSTEDGGVCVLGALEYALEPGDPRRTIGIEPDEFDAIERGFDGDPRRAQDPLQWWHVGARLAVRLHPELAR